jgi:hypothetical protein
MEEFKNKLADLFYGMTPNEAIKENICVSCKGKIKTFRDQTSIDEYQISAFCQKCQDETFGV